MAFIIKNVRDHAVAIGETILAKGEQLTFHTIPPEIGNLLDAGDLTITPEGPIEHIHLEPFHSGDKAIDG